MYANSIPYLAIIVILIVIAADIFLTLIIFMIYKIISGFVGGGSSTRLEPDERPSDPRLRDPGCFCQGDSGEPCISFFLEAMMLITRN